MGRILTLAAANHFIISSLSPIYGHGEAQWMARIILEELRGFSQTDILLRGDFELGQSTSDTIYHIVERLLHGEPLQYILGRAQFHGLTLSVNSSVLIPRPETAELVDIIVDRHGSQSDLLVTDLCTGSGCIALALARSLRFPSIMATDFSQAALDVAQSNAIDLHIRSVRFVRADLLRGETPVVPLTDIIVSNPPYIAQSEAASMEPNVIDHEPHSALFVPDADPLLFYRAIADYALRSLRPSGWLYMEINPLFATELQSMLSLRGFEHIDILPDSHGRQRFAIAQL